MEQWTDYKFEYENTYKVLQEQWEINDKLKKEKQDLVKYLEDKIEENKNYNRVFLNYSDYQLKTMYSIKVEVYQEILDKIKEGNYE